MNTLFLNLFLYAEKNSGYYFGITRNLTKIQVLQVSLVQKWYDLNEPVDWNARAGYLVSSVVMKELA